MLKPSTVEEYKAYEESFKLDVEATKQRNPRRGPGRPTKEEAERKKQLFDELRKIVMKDKK